VLLSVADYEAAATERLPEPSLAFIMGGAGEQRTLDANIAAYDAIRLLPRVLVDVTVRGSETTVLGQRVSFPILIAPTAMHRIAHPDGELASARAAGSTGTIMILSLGSSLPVEDVMAAANGQVWFQAYVGRDRGLTTEVIGRAEASGCSALVVTVDAPVVGGRMAERRHGFEVLPEWFASGHTPMYGLTAPGASGASATELWDASLSWGDLIWLRSRTRMPIVLKGLLRADDAARAVAEGVEGIVVSNHGGRQLDSAVPTMHALPAVVDAVGGQSAVLVDGGIRRGGDVFKALALGAEAVLVGRPVMWGLAVNGQMGVEHVLRLLADELDLTMALCGATGVAGITADLVAPP